MKRGIFIENIESDELREFIRTTIREELGQANNQQDSAKDLLTRTSAAAYLGVSLPTLNRYVTSGRLRSRKIGGKVFFTHEDINSAMK
jgi:excisionase family DNA binding protein